MPIVNIIRRASNYILGSDEVSDSDDIIYEDNEILFCKNNVCVHPPAFARQESDILHYPGYLTVTTKTFIDQYNNAKRPTLLLTWIPNATLRKCPSTVENGLPPSHLAAFAHEQQHLQRQYSDELKQNKFFSQHFIEQQNNKKNGSQLSLVSNNTNPFLDPYFYTNGGGIGNGMLSLGNGTTHTNGFGADNSDAASVSSNSDRASSTGAHSSHGNEDAAHDDHDDVFSCGESKRNVITEEEHQLNRECEPLIVDDDNKALAKQNARVLLMHQQPSVTSVNITIADPTIQNTDLSPDECVVSHVPDKFLRTTSVSSVEDVSPNWMTPELFAYKHNLAFPDSATASPIMTRKIPLKCRRFSVDLSQMRSLRLFFNDENCTSGQLVIASRESQYKILHFHHGGLDHLAQVLHQWHCLLHNIKLAPGHEEPNLPYRQFMVCRPEVKKSELHPDEDNVSKITTDFFYGTLLNEKGQIEDDLLLRKCVFFGGLEKSLRKTVWPFLLHCYSVNSTFEDRAVLMEIRRQVSLSSFAFHMLSRSLAWYELRSRLGMRAVGASHKNFAR